MSTKPEAKKKSRKEAVLETGPEEIQIDTSSSKKKFINFCKNEEQDNGLLVARPIGCECCKKSYTMASRKMMKNFTCGTCDESFDGTNTDRVMSVCRRIERS